jgi:putative ABC transport system substrate-binding protein
LGEHGYTEGQTIVIEERYAEGRAERLPALAAELIGLPVDVIVTAGAPATQAAKHATGSIPIVAVASDPIGTGLIGGNVTGLALGAPGLPAKRLELLKSAFPWISRVGYLADMGNAVTPLILQEVQDTAEQIGVQAQTLEVRGPDDFDAAFDAGANAQLDAFIVLDDPLTFAYRTKIVEFAANNGLVANYERREWAEAGGLMAYGVNFHDVLRRAAGHVDKLLKGAKPAELAVEPPTKFDFTINLQTAQDLGVSIPESVRALATEVIADPQAAPAPAAAR